MSIFIVRIYHIRKDWSEYILSLMVEISLSLMVMIVK